MYKNVFLTSDVVYCNVLNMIPRCTTINQLMSLYNCELSMQEFYCWLSCIVHCTTASLQDIWPGPIRRLPPLMPAIKPAQSRYCKIQYQHKISLVFLAFQTCISYFLSFCLSQTDWVSSTVYCSTYLHYTYLHYIWAHLDFVAVLLCSTIEQSTTIVFKIVWNCFVFAQLKPVQVLKAKISTQDGAVPNTKAAWFTFQSVL